MEDQNKGLGSMTGREVFNFAGGCALVYVCVWCLMAYPALVIATMCGGVEGMGLPAWFVTVCFIVWCFFNTMNHGPKIYKTMLIWLYCLTLSPFLQYLHYVYREEYYGFGKFTVDKIPEGVAYGDRVVFEAFRYLAPLDFMWVTEVQNAENLTLLNELFWIAFVVSIVVGIMKDKNQNQYQ